MSSRLLIVSTLDSKEPFGAFTRPFYLGLYLAQHFEVCQLGLDCATVDYAKSVTVGERGLSSYVRKLRQCIDDFQPDIIYAQETLPGIAALITCKFYLQKPPPLIFDFHTLSANEYWTRLSSSSNKTLEFKQLVKTYLAQGLLVLSGNPIIAAGSPVAKGIKTWYGFDGSRIHCVGNGVPEDLLLDSSTPDPYGSLRPAKIAVVVAPKTFQFPSNDMSVDMTIDIAKLLRAYSQDIHFVIIGRDGKDLKSEIPSNVSFTGFLSSRLDFIAHLKHADIGLLPFSKLAVAGGARNKSLDLLACHKLVVSTPEGMRGLDAFHDGEHLLISGDSTESLAATLLDACQNIEKYHALAEVSAELVRQKYSWAAMAEKVTGIINSYSRFSHEKAT
jgi:glycosyltransferase involved in cell wall biosynthesis